MINAAPTLLQVREALEASWDEKTSYQAALKKGNPALGQCYPTSRVVQHFFPDTQIIKGKVWSGTEIETHFWNGLTVNGTLYHIDLSWRQFAAGSSVREFEMFDHTLAEDSDSTVQRCELLLQRVIDYLDA
jgi:hypothetical protein